MSSREAAIDHAKLRAWAMPWTLASYIAIGVAALLPRVLDLGRWLSGDEASFWLRRSQIFLDAVRTGDFAATAITTHPGVTTMWLGAAGLVLNNMLARLGLLHDFSFATFLAIIRLPTALVHVAGVLAGYALLRRLTRPATAALAALLWALDPFVIAFSRVLHVDALPATFITVSLLAACLYWHHDRRRRWLVLSAIVGGLGVLSKSPALALLPGVGAIALLSAFREDQRPTTNERYTPRADQRPTTNDPERPLPFQSPYADEHPSFVVRRWSFFRPLALWGALCALTVFALWPALWVGPLRAYEQVQIGIQAEALSPHMLGNFFLGQEDDSPGPLFYPAALALRLTPWSLMGLLALPLIWRRVRDVERRDLAALACFTIIFVVAMSVFPKKFNRYLVPTFPIVDILAAYGLVGLGAWVLRFLQARRPHFRIANRPALLLSVYLGAIGLAAALNAAYWHPYGIVAFNQLLGGAAAGPRTFAIGWGEGLSDAAAWLNQQPDITGVRVATTMTTGLQSYLRRGAQSVVPGSPELPPKTGYVVIYARQVQWDRPEPPFDEFYGRETPAHVVQIHGIDYAWIYRTPPVERPRAADFGPIHLHGYTFAAPPTRGKPLTVQMVWKAREPAVTDYMLFAHLIGADGKRYAQVDLPYPTTSWPAGTYQSAELAVPLPSDLSAGTYRLVIGMYDPRDGARLPLVVDTPVDPALDGPNALPLAEITLK